MSATCHYGVTRQGEYQPCDKPAVGERVDDEYPYNPYPVCQRHFNKRKQPTLPWRDMTVQKYIPGTDERAGTVTAHWRPCRDHEAHFDSGLIVLSCSKCLHCSGPIADCAEHTPQSARVNEGLSA